MSGLPRELRDLIESGPLAHLSTINADGSPQVSVIWIGLDGDDLVSGHMQWYAKLRNIERDPRVVLSFDAPRAPGVVMNPYAVLRARAVVEPPSAVLIAPVMVMFGCSVAGSRVTDRVALPDSVRS